MLFSIHVKRGQSRLLKEALRQFLIRKQKFEIRGKSHESKRMVKQDKVTLETDFPTDLTSEIFSPLKEKSGNFYSKSFTSHFSLNCY